MPWDSYVSLEETKVVVKEVFLSRPEKGVPAAYAIVDRDSGRMIGVCDIFFLDWEREVGEIGCCLNRKYWNKGYMMNIFLLIH